MRKTLIAAALVATFGFAGAATAATKSDSAELLFTVNSTCNFDVMEASIQGDITDDGAGGFLPNNTQFGNYTVTCNQGVPYTIETDAAAGGEVILTGDTLGNTISAWMFQGDDFSFSQPFGTLANGEQISGTATGGTDGAAFTVAFNTESDGQTPRLLPAADVYRATVNFTFTY